MLSLDRRTGQSIVIDGDIRITVMQVNHKMGKLSVNGTELVNINLGNTISFKLGKIEVMLTETSQGKCRLQFKADKSVEIFRDEIWDRIKTERGIV